jgi:cytochrome c-type biogenesis protein CcmH
MSTLRTITQQTITAVLAGLLLPLLAHAVDNTPPLPNDALQQRYHQLTRELRCMQCQNESLADSNVGLAADLRLQVRELLIAGKSNGEIREHMASRYSDFILFRPRFSWGTSWLWGLPAMLLLAGGVAVWRVQRRRQALLAEDHTAVDES